MQFTARHGHHGWTLHDSILVLSILSLVMVLIGTALAAADLTTRIRKLRAFKTEAAGDLPASYNEDRDIMRILADREPALVAAEMRGAVNELIDAMAQERRAREATDHRLAQLAGVGDNLRQLAIGTALLLGGAVAGGIAGILAAT